MANELDQIWGDWDLNHFSEVDDESSEEDVSSHHASLKLDKRKSTKGLSQADIAYLYSIPLIKWNEKKVEPMGLPIDYQSELEELSASLLESHWEVKLLSEPASIESFNSLLLGHYEPKVLHLSCHGDYDQSAG